MLAAGIVCKEHMGFIKRRFLRDKLLIAWEGLEWARETGQKALLFKIDFEKGYDRIEWDFILNMLDWLRFRCVSSGNSLF